MRSLKSLFFALTAAGCISSTQALAARYVDVPGNWAETYINILADKDFFPADPEGKFKPDEPVTRAVLSAWLVKTLGIDNQPVSGQKSYADVSPGDWFYKPVEILRQNNYITGYPDGFRPHQFIQKGEVIEIIARIAALPGMDDKQIETELSKYKDEAKVPPQARLPAAQLSLKGMLLCGPDSLAVGADKLATRADTAALIFKLDELVGRKDAALAVKDFVARNATGPGQTGGPGPAPQGYPAPFGSAPGYSGQPPYASGGYPGAYTGAPRYAFDAAPAGYAQPPENRDQQPAYGSVPPPFYPGQPGPNQQAGYPPAGGAWPQQPAYQGQVYMQGGAPYTPPPSGDRYSAQTQGGPPPGGYYGQNPQYAPFPSYPGQPPQGPGNMLQGGLAVVAAGTQFRATLKNSLDSGSSQPGEEVRCTLMEPVYANGQEAIPAGSTLTGQVTSVTPAHRFQAGANGKIDITFTQVETPDGRRFPLSARINTDAGVSLQGGTTAGRIGKGLVTTGVGAASGAALGTALGAIVGGTSNARVGRATGMGAVFGTALGAGVGGVGAIVRKGSEVKLPAGMALPIMLDQSMQVTLAGQQRGYPAQQPGGYPGY